MPRLDYFSANDFSSHYHNKLPARGSWEGAKETSESSGRACRTSRALEAHAHRDESGTFGGVARSHISTSPKVREGDQSYRRGAVIRGCRNPRRADQLLLRRR